ncbi:MAG TPA: sigma-54 dependent transcriptional regulator [Bryobacteraceae bacterium]|nr:sigma-54 dependent transcriptional regulator [Bryobacteraceae bacterium]
MPGNATRVLIVDDEDSQRLGLASMITSWGFLTETAADGQEALDKLTAFQAHVMVTDLMMPKMDGFELLRRLNAQGSGPPAIVVTAFGNIETAIATIHDLGAFWFLEKPIEPRALRILLDRAASQQRLAEETERLKRELSYQGVLAELVGRSSSMLEVFSLIRQVAPSKAAVLITGESGTGKELVARAIHSLSPRANGPFVAINCAAMPETLMESELFGHEKGAFTGALERRAGCFELAQNGTLLLDEIGDMPITTQAKLLRVLEDSRVRRLGGKSEMLVDVRVIAATNRQLEEAIKKGEIREDLYYRLNVFRLNLPPLRERLDDIPILAEALIRDMNRKHGTKIVDLAPDVLDQFLRHHWPGNVRELRNALERATILAGEGTINMQHLPSNFSSGGMPARMEESSDPNSVRLRIGTTISEAEKVLIQRTLVHTRNNKTRAAEILGISLKTLHNKLKEYGAAEASASEAATS